MFIVLAFLIFTGALFAAGCYALTVPQQESAQVLAGRLRELHSRG